MKPLMSLSDWGLFVGLSFGAGFSREIWGFETVVFAFLILNFIYTIKR